MTSKKSKVGGIILPQSKTYCKPIKQCGIDININFKNQQNSPETNPSICRQLLFDRSAKALFNGKKIVFSANGSETVDSLYVKELNFDPYHIQKLIQNGSYTEG